MTEEGEGKYYNQQNRRGNDATQNTTLKKGRKITLYHNKNRIHNLTQNTGSVLFRKLFIYCTKEFYQYWIFPPNTIRKIPKNTTLNIS